MATNGAPERGESACSERAASSLPVPDSPSTSTVASDAAMRGMMSRTAAMAGLVPSSRSVPFEPSTMRRSPATSRRSRTRSTACWSFCTSSRSSKGFVKKP